MDLKAIYQELQDAGPTKAILVLRRVMRDPTTTEQDAIEMVKAMTHSIAAASLEAAASHLEETAKQEGAALTPVTLAEVVYYLRETAKELKSHLPKDPV